MPVSLIRWFASDKLDPIKIIVIILFFSTDTINCIYAY